MNRVRLAAATMMATALSTQAHPGHGPLSEGAAHFFSSPSHTIPVTLAGAALWMASSYLKQPRTRAAVRTIGSVTTLGALTLWGISA